MNSAGASSSSTATTGGSLLSKQSSDNLLTLLKGEDTTSIGGGFYAKYEPKEILGRLVPFACCARAPSFYLGPLSPSFFLFFNRGLSSTVRKCICRESGVEYAVKIIDKSQDNSITDAVTAEIEVLRFLPKHQNISKYRGFCLRDGQL